MSDERAKFEAWMLEKWPGVDLEKRDDGEYWSLVPDSYWSAWQARAALAQAEPGQQARASAGPDAESGLTVERRPVHPGDALGRCFDCMWKGAIDCPHTADVTAKQLYEAIDADFAGDTVRYAWRRLDKHTKDVWRGYANVVNAFAQCCARDQVRSTTTEGRGPEGDEPGPKDAPKNDRRSAAPAPTEPQQGAA